MNNITPIHRPPVGVWPPCPPVVPCPPPVDCMGISGLERCYEEVKRAQEFLKQMIKDIIACDPSIIGSGVPLVGVTDGSPAQPGMVGEFVMFSTTITWVLGAQTWSAGILQPGDWDVWLYGRVAQGSVFYTSCELKLDPVPAGFSDVPAALDDVGGASNSMLTSYAVQLLTAVPTLLPVLMTIGASAAGGQMYVAVAARRRR